MAFLHAPKFWRHDQNRLLPALLSPASLFVMLLTARRIARPGWRAPIPVICCGNPGVGGAGKTTLALDLANRLRQSGLTPHFLTRGHGGTVRGPIRVDLALHTAAQVGDEALLLARSAPTWVGANRAATAKLAASNGADILVMDDGLQNPTLIQDCKFLVIDGAAGFGNGRVLPAGPLREPVRAAAARATAAILIGPDETGSLDQLPSSLPVLRARLQAGPELAPLAGRTVFAFAGIGRPDKFFTMLYEEGLHLAGRIQFPDHYVFSPGELAYLRAEADRLGATLVTTPKDHVRIPAPLRAGITPIGVRLAWLDSGAVDSLLAGLAAPLNPS